MLTAIVIIGLMALLYFSFKIMKNITLDDFLSNSKSTTSFNLFLSLLASLIGGWMFLGLTQMAYEAGLIGLYIGIGYSIGFFILYKVSPKIKKLMDKFDSHTLDETISKYYGVKVGIFITVINFIFFIAVLSAQFIVLQQILLPFSNILNIDLLFWVFAISVLLYTAFTGYKGVLLTDKYQLIFIVILMGLLIFSLGENQFIHKINDVSFNYIIGTNYGLGFIIAALIFFPLTVIVRTDLWQRIGSSKNIEYSKRAILYTIPFLLISYIAMTYIGLSINTMGIEAGVNTLPLISLINSLLNNNTSSIFFNTILLITLFGMGSALMSTIDSNLNVIVVAISRLKTKNKKSNDLLFVRILSIIIGLIGIIFSIFVSDIVNIIISAGAIILIMFPVVWNLIYSTKDKASKNEINNAIYTLSIGYISFILFVYFLDIKSAFLPGFLISFIFWHSYKYIKNKKYSNS